MHYKALEIPEVFLLTPRQYGDDRGLFMETFRADIFARETGVTTPFVQDNHSVSTHANTIRGLHYQRPPHAQAKLVRCTVGAVMDVAVDVRKGSPSYGRWVSALLSADNAQQLFVPAGFLHGFATLSSDAEVQYKCTDYYAAECDGNVAWNDPDLSIDWGVAHGFDSARVVLSGKDMDAPKFVDFQTPF